MHGSIGGRWRDGHPWPGGTRTQRETRGTEPTDLQAHDKPAAYLTGAVAQFGGTCSGTLGEVDRRPPVGGMGAAVHPQSLWDITPR